MKSASGKKKDYITDRFIQAMHVVIRHSKSSGGNIRFVQDFAKSIGHSSSNFSKFNTGRSVTVEMIQKICARHKVNPTWLILGNGSMFLNEENDLESRVETLEKKMKVISTS